MNKILTFLIAVFLLSGLVLNESLIAESGVPQQSEGLKNSESGLSASIKFGTGIGDREITGESNSFPAAVGKIYCWSLINGANKPTEIKHVWYHEGKKMSEINLTVKFPKTRTWSNKTILPEWTGAWKVEVIDADGQTITAAEFAIK